MKQARIIPLLKYEGTALPFKIQTIKDLVEQQDQLSESVHSHDYYEMVWLIKGKGKLLVDMEEHSIENNMIFCLKPHQAHQFLMDSGMEGFVFSFTDSFFTVGEHEFDISGQSTLYRLLTECRLIVMHKSIEPEIRNISQMMIKEYENQYALRTQLLKRYFKILLILLSRQLKENVEPIAQTREIELVKCFMGMLEKCFREKKQVSNYSSQLYVTANYLNRIVKKNTGYSAGHHIRQRVILEAKRMARYSGSGMKEIAYELGFLDSAHFSRFFKSYAGKNFSDFKKETFNFSLVASFNRA